MSRSERAKNPCSARKRTHEEILFKIADRELEIYGEVLDPDALAVRQAQITAASNARVRAQREVEAADWAARRVTVTAELESEKARSQAEMGAEKARAREAALDAESHARADARIAEIGWGAAVGEAVVRMMRPV